MSEKRKLDNWRIAHCMLPRDMFITYKEKYVKSLYGYNRKTNMKSARVIDFVYKVFRTALKFVVDDIIENGIQFNFTSSYRGDVVMFMDCINGERFREYKKMGYLKDFDPIKTNFSAYGIMINIRRKSGKIVQKMVHLDEKRKKRIIAKAEEGTMKCGVVKHYNDYYKDVLAVYPFIKEEDIYPILRFGFNAVARHLLWGLDILVCNTEIFFMTGASKTDSSEMFGYVCKQLKRKISVMYRKLYCIWDGYSYFTINEKKYDEIKDDLNKGVKINFGRVRLFRVYDMAVVWGIQERFLFRIKDDKMKNRYTYQDDLITSDAELIEEFEKDVFKALSNMNRPYLTRHLAKKNLRPLHDKNKKIYENLSPRQRKRRMRNDDDMDD